MQPRATSGGERVRECVAHDRVDEGKPTRLVGDLPDQAPFDRRLEDVQRAVEGQSHDLGHDRKLELGAADRRRVQHRVRFGAERAHPAADGFIDPDWLTRDELLDKERVPAGLIAQRLDRLGREPVSAQSAHSIDAQPGESDPIDHELVRQPRQRLRKERMWLGVAIGRNQHARRSLGARGETLEQPDRRRFGPVEIVQHEQRRPPDSDRVERGSERFEQP